MSRCINPVYVRLEKGGVFAPCGLCIECKKTRQGDWIFRINKELKYAKTAFFITLTYDDKHLPLDHNLQKADLQNFMKRLRKISTEKLKYYAVGEYGGETHRPHYHAIIFNLDDPAKIQKAWTLNGETIGFVYVGTVTTDSIAYVTSYIIPDGEEPLPGIYQQPFAVMSKNLGLEYLKRNWNWHKNGLKNYVLDNGFKKHFPRYYSDKLFNFKEKERIANENVTRIAEKEYNEIKNFKTPTDFFADRLENREQQVSKIIKKSKKNKL